MTTATREQPVVKERTLPEKILLAAADLGQGDRRVFAAEELAVAAWKAFPKEFSLHGFDLPDNNKSLSILMGHKGMVNRGYLERVQSRKYRVTELGREAIRRMLQGELPGLITPAAQVPVLLAEVPQKAILPDFLVAMRDSAAARKFGEGNLQAVNFAEACLFWGIAGGTKTSRARERLGFLASKLRGLAESGGDGSSLGRYLQTVDGALRKKFTPHLKAQGIL